MFGENLFQKKDFPRLYKLLQITIIILVSFGTRDRSFSSIWRIKKLVKGEYVQERFNDTLYDRLPYKNKTNTNSLEII